MLTAAREFFASRGVLEVETPVLSSAAVSDPQIESLATRVAGMRARAYLCTSPEYAMKRLLAAGSGDIYQICKVFRDGERGRWHNPEFTLIEWYRLGFDDAALMTEVEALIGCLLAPHQLAPAERLSYSAALQRHAGVDAHGASDSDLTESAQRHGIVCDAELDRDAKLDLLMGRVVARFELYLHGVELANGFHELVNAGEQRARFTRELSVRRARGQVEPPLDERLQEALAAGMPDCAGVALGFDRLVAVALGAPRLGDAMAFTIDNA